MKGLCAEDEPHLLHFRRPATTSRGSYTTRRLWLVKVWHSDNPELVGVGECAPLPDLSCDALPEEEYARILRDFCDQLVSTGEIPFDALADYPSMFFGIETAVLHLQRGSLSLYDTPFGRGESGITINGLVWMGDHQTMLEEMERKLAIGFRCIKLKIGAIQFEREVDLLKRIRERFPASTVEIRLDANGAFPVSEVMQRLETLSKYDIHSIEQPIRAGQYAAMADVCRNSPIPVALDEELIGVNRDDERSRLLDTISPAYIIVKPSLHGGIRGTRRWVHHARERGIGSWLTSALESNVGLNAIAHLAADIYGDGEMMPQGLGTGQLFTDNFPYPLAISGDRLYFKG